MPFLAVHNKYELTIDKLALKKNVAPYLIFALQTVPVEFFNSVCGLGSKRPGSAFKTVLKIL
jgi:hypothetical protein